ncbi:SH3 domain-containing protein [Enterovirga sp.]|uniref:SH3 domain-containing protein n=1 Tax=Enterovirga sp. TaxID=2026350 RepID=UPI003FA58DA7
MSLFSCRLLAALLAGGLLAALPMRGEAASEIPLGKVSGLPVPRYVSLKTDRVNLREGPSKDHRTAWVFQRAGLPVEITAEYETWRRIRDAEGTEGWVLHSLLSGRRTALVMPWAKAGTQPLALYARADDHATVVAQLQPNVIANVKTCREGWCRVVIGTETSGYIKQDHLWGVYPNETVE